jgi:hypothetical protein
VAVAMRVVHPHRQRELPVVVEHREVEHGPLWRRPPAAVDPRRLPRVGWTRRVHASDPQGG